MIFISDLFKSPKNISRTIIILLIFLGLTIGFIHSVLSDITSIKKFTVSEIPFSEPKVIELVICIKNQFTEEITIVNSIILLNPSLVQIDAINDYYRKNLKVVDIQVITY